MFFANRTASIIASIVDPITLFSATEPVHPVHGFLGHGDMIHRPDDPDVNHLITPPTTATTMIGRDEITLIDLIHVPESFHWNCQFGSADFSHDFSHFDPFILSFQKLTFQAELRSAEAFRSGALDLSGDPREMIFKRSQGK